MNGQNPQERKAIGEAMKGMRSFVLYMIADFALIAGVVLILFGVGEFLSSGIGVPGIWNVALGVMLFIIGFAVLARSRARVQFGVQPPMQPQPPPEMQKPPEEPVGSYR